MYLPFLNWLGSITEMALRVLLPPSNLDLRLVTPPGLLSSTPATVVSSTTFGGVLFTTSGELTLDFKPTALAGVAFVLLVSFHVGIVAGEPVFGERLGGFIPPNAVPALLVLLLL